MPCVYLTTNLVNNKKYIGVDTKDDPNYFGSGIVIREAIKKYGKTNFKKDILEYNPDKKYLFEREIYWINKYDAVNSNDFYNLSLGGKGGNMLNNESSIEKWKQGIEKSKETTIKFRKNKTYEEIYGEKSELEKHKRKKYGRKKSKEELEKMSIKLKGKEPWNKGLNKSTDERVLKYTNNKTKHEFIKVYILSFDDKYLEFNGKNKLEEYIKIINMNRNLKNRINVDKLIKELTNKEFKLEIKSCFPKSG